MTRRTGPYATSGGHLFWSDVSPDGSKKTVLVHREMMEQYLGRTLSQTEVVHHKNGNPADNRIENLEVKQRGQHTRDHRPAPEMIDLVCAWCGVRKAWLARQVRSNQTVKGRKGPFCDKSCAGKWSRQQQIDRGQTNLRSGTSAGLAQR
jgi:hypothetical protein